MIEGIYEIAKTLYAIDGKPGLYDAEAVINDHKRQFESGEINADELEEELRLFTTRIEFTPDGEVISRMKIPDGVTEEEIREAVEAGEIGEVKDGYFEAERSVWKMIDGVPCYDSKNFGEEGEADGPTWKELVSDSEGLIDYALGIMKLRKIG